MESLISVIIPVYNVEKYLDRCISSVVNQTYKNLEIILVDDGSPDRCPEICDEWAKKDPRIKVIHKENGGPGQAKNTGIESTNGEFIGLVDSDDYISVNMYEYLYSLFDDETDIVECDLVYTTIDDEKFNSTYGSKVTYYTTEQAMEYHIQDRIFRQTPPNKLYRKSAVSDHRFREGTKIDDEFWTYKVIGASRKLAHVECKLYAYRQQECSIMHSKYSLNRLQAIEAKRERLEYLKKHYPSLSLEATVNLLFSCIYQGQMVYKYIDKNERTVAVEYLKSVLKENKIASSQLGSLPLKHRVWLRLSQISLKLTCKLRNLLKIGF